MSKWKQSWKDERDRDMKFEKIIELMKSLPEECEFCSIPKLEFRFEGNLEIDEIIGEYGEEEGWRLVDGWDMYCYECEMREIKNRRKK